MPCDCFEQVNAQLAEHNTRLARPWRYREVMTPKGRTFAIDCNGTFVATEKLDTSKRGKALPVIAARCPFCGCAYKKKEEEASDG